MNRPTDSELRNANAYYVDIHSKLDTDFQAFARLLQSKWRAENDYPIGQSKKNHCGNFYGNFIEEDFSNKNECNFLSEKIRNIAQKEMEKARHRQGNKDIYEDDKFRTYCNLLSSKALSFNLFGEFSDRDGRKDILLNIFNELKPNLMDKITEIEFEYGDKKYLGDGTAFDVLIKYEKDNKKSFLGIEVKYSEDLTEESRDKAEKNFERHKKIYTYYTENYGIFKSNVIDEIKYPPYSQIWRDHLLSISMKNQEKYDDGYFVCLYPFNNKECRSGIKNYVNKFLQNLEASFFEIYVEKFIEIIKNHMEDRGKKVFDRYVKGL